jgi:cell shape-determining protein MreC
MRITFSIRKSLNGMSKVAGADHHLNDKLVQALARIDELEHENAELKEEVAKLKRSSVFSIK